MIIMYIRLSENNHGIILIKIHIGKMEILFPFNIILLLINLDLREADTLAMKHSSAVYYNNHKLVQHWEQ